MKKSFTSASDLDGFDDLKEEDQDKVTAAWEAGKVADEDVPESARKPGGAGDEEEEEEGEKPKKGRKKAQPKKVSGRVLWEMLCMLLC